MENSRPKQEKIVKYMRNLLRIKKELDYTTIKKSI